MYIDSPARPAGHALHHLVNAIAERAGRIRRRRQFKTLLGVLRHEVESAANLPLSVDAATELRRVSLERRRRKLGRLGFLT